MKAFWMYTDVANKARHNIAEYQAKGSTRLVVPVLEGIIEQSIQRALELFDPFIPDLSHFNN